VPGPLGDLGRRDPRIQPGRNGCVAQVVRTPDSGEANSVAVRGSARAEARCLLHAAALGDRTPADLYRWSLSAPWACSAEDCQKLESVVPDAAPAVRALARTKAVRGFSHPRIGDHRVADGIQDGVDDDVQALARAREASMTWSLHAGVAVHPMPAPEPVAQLADLGVGQGWAQVRASGV
jgi:hypothetical protein